MLDDTRHCSVFVLTSQLQPLHLSVKGRNLSLTELLVNKCVCLEFEDRWFSITPGR